MPAKTFVDTTGGTPILTCAARTDKDICACPDSTQALVTWTVRGNIRDWAKGSIDPVPSSTKKGIGDIFTIGNLFLDIPIVLAQLIKEPASKGFKKVVGKASRPRRKELPACVSRFTALKALSTRNNGLESLDNVASIPFLQQLDAPVNRIKKFVPLPKTLEAVNLNDNKIQKIEHLDGMDNLSLLSLKNNDIKFISGLDGAPNLVHLDLENNKITSVTNLGTLDKLESIDLRGNDLRGVRGFGWDILEQIDRMASIKTFDAFAPVVHEGKSYPDPMQYEIDQHLARKKNEPARPLPARVPITTPVI